MTSESAHYIIPDIIVKNRLCYCQYTKYDCNCNPEKQMCMNVQDDAPEFTVTYTWKSIYLSDSYSSANDSLDKTDDEKKK